MTDPRQKKMEVTERSRRVMLSYCAAQVRTHQPERYLATLAAPEGRREALFALYAFDHEITRVRHVVSEPMAGLIRLQWWREALAEIEGGVPPRAHPVAQGLAQAVAVPRGSMGLHIARLDAAIEACERDLEDPPPATLDAFERHLEARTGPVARAALDLLDVASDAASDAGRHSGLALAIAETLRAIPEDARRRRLLLPQDLVARHGIDAEPVFRGAAGPGLRSLVRELVARARTHLHEARQVRRAVPRDALPALLPGTLAESWLARLARAGHDPFAAPLRRASPRAALKLLWYRSAGRY